MAPGQPFQSHGFQTSIDTARQQTTTATAATATTTATATVAGVKRPLQTLEDRQPRVTTSAASLHSYTHRQVQDSTPDHNNYPKIVPAAEATHASRIAASAISGPTSALVPPPATQARPQPAASPLLSLQHPKYGLPPTLVSNFKAVGIDSIYPWQASCLLGRGHLSGERNLLYSAPTGGGKSLVSDVLMLKRVIEQPARKAILVLPYVAVVQEKLKWLRRIVQDVEKNIVVDNSDNDAAAKPWTRPPREIRITGFFGGSKSRTTWADTDIAVCTIEKVSCCRHACCFNNV
jgi:DNA polymerase theta